MSVERLIGVYHADGSVLGELRYVVGHALGRTHCSLCDITHGRVREKEGWRAARAGLPVPFVARHLDERTPAERQASEGRTPCVLADAGGDLSVLLDAEALEACAGDPDALAGALSTALDTFRGVILYVDAQSPYAYLAEAREIGAELQVVALGAIMVKRGWGSWAHTGTRAEHIAEIEQRAAARGLPPLTWPDDWPAQTLVPTRTAFWAEQQGSLQSFLRAYWRRVFAENRPAGDEATLAEAVEEAGLSGTPVIDQSLKDALRERTDAAWEAGVRGIPTLDTGAELIFGDDAIAARPL